MAKNFAFRHAVSCLALLAPSFCIACDMLFNLPEEPAFVLESSSPNKVNTIKLERKRQVTSPNDPWSWKLFLSVRSSNNVVLADNLIMSGDDSSNTGFPQKVVPELMWVSENVVRLAGKDAVPDSQCDIAFVTNSSNQTLSYLAVEGGDSLFFLLNVKPGEAFKLFVQPQSDKGRDHSWLHAFGLSSTGAKLSTESGNFYIRGRYQQPSHYCFTVNDSSIALVSQEYESFKIFREPADEKRLNELLRMGKRTKDEENELQQLFSKTKEVRAPSAPKCFSSGDQR